MYLKPLAFCMPKASCSHQPPRRLYPSRTRSSTQLPVIRTRDECKLILVKQLSKNSNAVDVNIRHEDWAPWISSALQKAVNLLSTFGGGLINENQMKLLKQVTAVLADAMMPPGAPPSLRLLVRRALRAAVLLTHSATFFIRIWAVPPLLEPLWNSARRSAMQLFASCMELLKSGQELLHVAGWDPLPLPLMQQQQQQQQLGTGGPQRGVLHGDASSGCVSDRDGSER
ncbi:hypothetical protein VOLCADRAFT_87946 [Volvox carteri f. nagariensis]|uniref:Uncharacterized protein n=1 Tax=Volvox carteri f. nagariensis TaxID=3068 RepID=D8TMN4_VOLCA|nr:uncharacterized protein VOLCADRAFT_87946 [Volvox carteri f. nagariensis]EFJ51155.1 hypothetical protein VOLCADRAFT_87946 [Volvox carteri f. nagariensis]|eukprot:XP_002947622.1 hypothetical protein VOLCADRAFT_87946 [Volvox carteri f. nagariensis]